MKKLLMAAAAVCAMLLSGCTPMPEGYDRVRAAKNKYEELDSARTVMTDLATGETIMELEFFINSNDEMVLSYYGKDGEDEMYAYSNGAEYFYKEPDAEKWKVIGSDDENYIYNLYNREYRYPYAQGGIFFLDGASVESAAVTDNADGSCSIEYVYDADRLNESTQGILDGVSSFSSLQTTFEINADGYITAFSQRGVVTDTEGTVNEVNMRISVDMMNQVHDIPYPVDKVEK